MTGKRLFKVCVTPYDDKRTETNFISMTAKQAENVAKVLYSEIDRCLIETFTITEV